MPQDYGSASARHYDNSAYLAADARWREAAYLAGYAAECALKLLVERGGRGYLRGPEFSHDLAMLQGEGLSLAGILSPLLRRIDRRTVFSPSGAPAPVGLGAWSEQLRYEDSGSPSQQVCEGIVHHAHRLSGEILVGLTLDGILEDLPS